MKGEEAVPSPSPSKMMSMPPPSLNFVSPPLGLPSLQRMSSSNRKKVLPPLKSVDAAEKEEGGGEEEEDK